MTDDEGRGPRRDRHKAAGPPVPQDTAITPDDAASALERGARIFERLLRRR